MLTKSYGEIRDKKIKSPKGYLTYTTENGQRVTKKRRGTKRYFVFLQERFSDLYCLLVYSIGMPELLDNFKEEDLCFVHKDIKSVREFLISKSEHHNKSITFCASSLRIK